MQRWNPPQKQMASNDSSSHSDETDADRADDDRSRLQLPTRLQRDELPTISDRYAALTLAADETYIYDRGDPDAWIQSDTARSLERAV